MDQALITGSTGLIGKALARHLLSKGIEVICIGRRKLSDDEIIDTFGQKVNYHYCLMKDINNLPDIIKKKSSAILNECCFFHLAWGTELGLTTGTLKDQMENAAYSAIAIKIAKIIGCSKFITSGSLEETFIGDFISSKSNIFESMQSNYGLAKIASRDMCSITAYLEKIDYVHTRLSAPLSPSLDQRSYIANTLKKILNNEEYDPPKNKKYFDIISINDVTLAFELIGKKGKNKSNYFIGTGNPIKLLDFFKIFKEKLKDNKYEITTNLITNDMKNLFNINDIYNDTGFKPQIDLFDIVNQGSTN